MSELLREKNSKFYSSIWKNYRWNFTVNVIDYGLFNLGMGFVSITTILPFFVRQLTSSNLIVGLIPSVAALGYALPQILSARYVERLRHRKYFLLQVGIGERLPWLFLGMVSYFLGKGLNAQTALVLFFLFYAIITFSGGIGGSAWYDLLAKVIPQGRRGLFFGFNNFVGGGLGFLGGLAATRFLAKFSFPYNFSLCFLAAFLATTVSWVALALNREPPYPTVIEPMKLKSYLLRLYNILKGNRNYSLYLLSKCLLSFSGASTAFYTVYALQKFRVSPPTVGIYTALTLLGQMLGNLVWGYLGDKKGFKIVLEVGTLCNILSIILALLAASPHLFYVIFFSAGCAVSANNVASPNIVFEFCPGRERVTYIGLTNTLLSPFMAGIPLIGGILADRSGYPPTFAVSLSMVIVGLLILSTSVKDPRFENLTCPKGGEDERKEPF